MEEDIIKSVAEFSKIRLDDVPVSNVLNFVKQIKDAKVNLADDFDRILEIDELRDDTVKPSLSAEDVFLNAKNVSGRYFVVPKAVD
ncbi:MAG: aspartyl/glutamyl-tRNA amidotransferase subunit C [Christensenellaceae bacterium]|jgi:aspartyl/glutamyl-tRNA(Asn/Gln) amidotransferase C subunit|nr:aspartyl/glutamyl-tRNA amidotransferase subunit C [Christensenellaceae bacterium]